MLLVHNAPSLSGSLNVENVPERMLLKKLCLERLVLRQIQWRFSASAGALFQSVPISQTWQLWIITEFCTRLQKLIANRLQKDTAGTVEMLCLQRTPLVLENHNQLRWSEFVHQRNLKHSKIHFPTVFLLLFYSHMSFLYSCSCSPPQPSASTELWCFAAAASPAASLRAAPGAVPTPRRWQRFQCRWRVPTAAWPDAVHRNLFVSAPTVEIWKVTWNHYKLNNDRDAVGITASWCPNLNSRPFWKIWTV